MTRSSGFKVGIGIAIAALAIGTLAIAALVGGGKTAVQAAGVSVDPSRLPRLGSIDARFQS